LGDALPDIYSEPYQKFLVRLRQARKESGLTQTQVAEIFSKPQSYVAKCESGERRVDIVELASFAKLYKKPLEFFLS
jgi:transcriptional regulator with XRE-family HTH domain